MALGSDAFHFTVPADRIAQEPAPDRAGCRLLVYDRRTRDIRHERFAALASFFRKGDCLVINETRVLPARLFGHKATGGRVEVLYLGMRTARVAEVLLRPGLAVGAAVQCGQGMTLTVVGRNPAGNFLVEIGEGCDFPAVLAAEGRMPLPPYIRRPAEERDEADYQTVFAREDGSVAAPTAGLHFTDDLLWRIESRGIAVVRIVLHIGLATFKKVRVKRFSEFAMLSETYAISPAAARRVNTARAAGGRVIAVGTSVVRTLETVGDAAGRLRPGSGSTEIFIHPGYTFRAVDAMLTNFHLPDSGPLFMTAAFLHNRKKDIEESPKVLHTIYAQALAEGYRFYSYGDAMLIG